MGVGVAVTYGMIKGNLAHSYHGISVSLLEHNMQDSHDIM